MTVPPTPDKPADSTATAELSPPVPSVQTTASPIAKMFGRIVGVYDPLNRLLSLGQDQHWRACLAHSALLALKGTSHPQVLDAAAGTLDVSLKLCAARHDVQVTALDFCLPMLIKGKTKLAGHRQITPVAGDALHLPLPDQSVHALTMAFGIRNISPREQAFAEMYRVLKPGGRACILEFSPPAPNGLLSVYGLYLRRLLPLVGRLFSGDSAYGYLVESIQSFPTPTALTAELRMAGFDRVYYVPMTMGIVCLHVAEKTV